MITLSASDVATVSRGEIEEGTPITGDLEPIESVEVRARIEGDVIGVFVREGDRVRSGQLLARFESSQQESGALSAEADRVAARGELATSQWDLEQTEELFKAGAIPERDLKAAQQAVTSARARLAAAEARVRSASSETRDTRVVSPTSGIVAQRTVEDGEHVASGTVLFTVVRNDVLELGASVPARNANDVRPGQIAHFVADGRAFDGRVARVSPTIDPSTRSITVYVQIPNADGGLKGGTFATGRVVGRVVSGTLVIPTSAIRQPATEGDPPYVYRLDGTTLAAAPVRLGIVDERAGRAQVVEGLNEGDRVVVGNVGTLGRGMQVQILGTGERGQGTAGELAPQGSRSP